MHRRFQGVVIVVGIICILAGSSVLAEGDWPGFRGPGHDGAVPADEGALSRDSLTLDLAWKRALGPGYSSIAVVGDRLVTMFTASEVDVMAAFRTDTGDEIWRYAIADNYAGHDGSHDGPISTPVIGQGRAFGLGPRGQLFALDLATGAEIWKINLVEDLEATVPYYGFSTSPLLADGVLVVEIGAEDGKAIAGFNPEDGSLLWTAGDDTIEYHSPIVAGIAGEQQVVAAGQENIYGLNARSGEVLWQYKHEGDKRAIGGLTIVPLPAGEGRLFLMNKVDSSVMLKVVKKRKSYRVKELWTSTTIKNSYVPPVYHDGYIYGMSNRIFTCMDAATGEIQWRSREPGDGFPVLVGDRLVMVTKPGSLHVVRATPDGYQELASLDLFGEHSWSEVSYSQGHLYARSMAHLARIDPVQGAGEMVASRQQVPVEREGDFSRFLVQVASSSDKKTVVDTFLAGQKSFPIIGDLGDVHFVYRGESDDVGIVGDMIGFRREDPMTQIEGTDFFYYTTVLEPDAAVTYGFIMDYAEPTPDPLNPRTDEGVMGELSWFAMPAWDAPDFLEEADASKQGRLESMTWKSEILEGEEQVVQVYLPAGYDAAGDRQYPTIYVLNGKAALEDGKMKQALDHLIGNAIEPVVGVFVQDQEDNPRRSPEAMALYVDMLAGELLPRVEKAFHTEPVPLRRAIVGAGRAGNMALMASFKRPDLFARVGVQSAMMGVSDFADFEVSEATTPKVIYLEWGTYHLRSPHEGWDMAENNRELWAHLREAGYRPAGGEVHEGFGRACWNGHTDEMLTALFPLRREEEEGRE